MTHSRNFGKAISDALVRVPVQEEVESPVSSYGAPGDPRILGGSKDGLMQ